MGAPFLPRFFAADVEIFLSARQHLIESSAPNRTNR